MGSIFTLVQITAAYSNAVLVAILPHFTDVAQKLDLPIHTPIQPSEIRHYFCDPRAGEVGGWVTLTNGYQFWFEKGHVNMFQSPSNYFSLQDPSRIPKFYGPLRMNQAAAADFVRQALRKLGYTNDVFDTVQPEVKLASSAASFASHHGVPHYKVIWHKPDAGHNFLDELAEVEVNADARRIEQMAVFGKQFWQPNPDVGVVPKPKPKPKPEYVGGYRATPFTAAYSNALMNAILPQISDFADKLNLPINLPVTLSQCTNIDGGLIHGSPDVQVILNNGDRFLFEHGYVTLYSAHDNYFWGNLDGHATVDKADLYGTRAVSKAEIVQIVREAINKLGYTDKLPEVQKKPDSIFNDDPRDPRAKYFTRYYVGWDIMDIPGMNGCKLNAEVDAKTKTLKILSLDNPNLWRDPPKIDVPEETKGLPK